MDNITDACNTLDCNSNFARFFREYNIEIPLIQRDYVQGSDKQSKKRDEFIDSLFESLTDQAQNCELDFIYGVCTDGFFQPLDGQQRMTTLFLLHWFLTTKSRIKDAQTTDTLICNAACAEKEFTYKTRRSSTVFCHKLAQYRQKALQEGMTMADDICQQSWFSEDWILDPTIEAMLQMLNAMDRKYRLLKQADPVMMLQRLLETKAINFDKLDMGRYKLNDSLYIKMNARGKQLTEFENWKAKFIKFLEDTYDGQDYAYAEQNRKDDFSSIKSYFTNSIEHEWTDMLWRYAVKDYKEKQIEYENLSEKEKLLKPRAKNPLIDDYFINFYYYIYRLCMFSSTNNDENNPSDADKEKKNNGTEKLRKEVFSKTENLEFLFQTLDLFANIAANNQGNITKFFEALFYCEGEPTDSKVRLFGSECVDIFKSCITDKATIDEQVLLYCIIRYCIANTCYQVTDDLKYYARICRNLLESVNQRLTKDMQMHSNVRLSRLSVYKKTIDSLCAFTSVKDLPEIAAGMGDTEAIFQAIRFYPDEALFRIEDSGYTHGCLYAFNLSMKHDKILTAFSAFKQATDLQRVRLLVAFGFHGSKWGACAHGQRVFYGVHGRWDVLFRHKDTCDSLKSVFEKFVSAYEMQQDIQQIISNEAERSFKEDCFAYYFLRYDSFANSERGWIMDQYNAPKDVYATHFFAVKSDFNIITLPRFNANPLLGYHTDPYATAVAQHLRATDTKIYSKMQYSGENRLKATIRFNDKNIVLRCTIRGWQVSFEKSFDAGRRLKISKLKHLSKLCTRIDGKHYLSIQNKDRIETAVEFIKEVYS